MAVFRWNREKTSWRRFAKASPKCTRNAKLAKASSLRMNQRLTGRLSLLLQPAVTRHEMDALMKVRLHQCSILRDVSILSGWMHNNEPKCILVCSPITMLAQIETYLEALVAQISASGATVAHVAALRKKVRAARRDKARLEQRQIELANQEERAHRAFLRAQTPAPARKVRPSGYSKSLSFLVSMLS